MEGSRREPSFHRRAQQHLRDCPRPLIVCYQCRALPKHVCAVLPSPCATPSVQAFCKRAFHVFSALCCIVIMLPAAGTLGCGFGGRPRGFLRMGHREGHSITSTRKRGLVGASRQYINQGSQCAGFGRLATHAHARPVGVTGHRLKRRTRCTISRKSASSRRETRCNCCLLVWATFGAVSATKTCKEREFRFPTGRSPVRGGTSRGGDGLLSAAENTVKSTLLRIQYVHAWEIAYLAGHIGYHAALLAAAAAARGEAEWPTSAAAPPSLWTPP